MLEETASFRREGEPAFPEENTENDNSADSQPEENDTDQTPPSQEDKDETQESDGGEDKPFDQHPRWKQREELWNERYYKQSEDWKKRFNDQEVRHTGEFEKIREEMGSISQKTNERKANIPSWFGGDETQWEEYQEHNSNLVSKARDEALREFTQKNESKQKAIQEATDYMAQSISDIEVDSSINPNGLKVDRNKLLKFTMDNDLVDSKGRWNWKAGFQLMNMQKTNSKSQKLKDKKNLAGATTSDKTVEDKPKDFMTAQDFLNPGKKPW